EPQLIVEVRKQRAAARRLPFQRRSERRRIHRDEDEIRLTREVPGGGLRDLVRGGEMNVAVGAVDRCAAKAAVALGVPPERARADLVDQGHWVGPGCGSWRAPSAGSAPAGSSGASLRLGPVHRM